MKTNTGIITLLAVSLLLTNCDKPETDGLDIIPTLSNLGHQMSSRNTGLESELETREVGPLEYKKTRRIRLKAYIPAFRVESYGETRIDLKLRGRKDAKPYIVIEGPLPGDGDQTPAGEGDFYVSSKSDGASSGRLQVTLKEKGVYRIMTVAGKGARLKLKARCLRNCSRPQIGLKDWLIQLRDSGQMDAITALVEAKLAQVVSDPELRALIMNEWRKIIASPDFEGIERFPTVPLHLIGQIQPLFGQIGANPPVADAVITGELKNILGDCNIQRVRPTPLDPAVPHILYGHFPNRALTSCQVANSRKIAKVLTSLAAQNGSQLTYAGKVINTPKELFKALMKSGHKIQGRNERMYANFLSLVVGETEIRWPVWLNTGLKLEDQSALSVPMGHSHHAWRISGPLVNGRIMFYLGISGTGFFAQTDTRPLWSQVALSYDFRKKQEIFRTIETAALYLRRSRVERETVAAGMPADGYGFLGVCNDSNAIIEYESRGTISVYPLIRAPELKETSILGDGLDQIFNVLPYDVAGVADRKDTLRRILHMSPFELDSPFIWDELLREQMKAVAQEL